MFARRVFGIYFFLFVTVFVVAQAPPIFTWQQCLGGSGSEGARDVIALSNGDYLAVGVSSTPDGDVSSNQGSSDAWITRLDGTGAIIWEASFGGSSFDGAESAVETNDGGFAILCTSESNDGDVSASNGEADLWVIKLDANGNLLWEHAYGGSDDEYAERIVETPQGDLFLLSTSWSTNGDITNAQGVTDIWVLKLDNMGNMLWQNSYGGSNADDGRALTADSNGGCYMGGFTSSNNGDISNFIGGFSDAWFVHLDGSGTILSEKNFGGSLADALREIMPLADGTFVCAGDSYSNDGDLTSNQGMDDIWVFKLDAALNVIWSKSYGGSQFETTGEAVLTPFNETILWTTSESSNGDVSYNQGGWDNWILKVDMNGDLVWEKPAGSPSFEFAEAIDISSSGKLIVTSSVGGQGADITCNAQSQFWIMELTQANVSVPENSSSAFVLVPLGNNAYQLQSSRITEGNIIIHDAKGGRALSMPYNGSSALLSLQRLPPGMYFISVNSANNKWHSKLLVY